MKRLHFSIIMILIVIPMISYAIMCPNSFNQINYGDTVDKVISICGAPSSQYQYIDTVSESNSNTYTAPNLYYTGNYYQPYGFSSTQQETTISHQRRITKLIYYGMQPAVLIFVNGQLEERELLHE